MSTLFTREISVIRSHGFPSTSRRFARCPDAMVPRSWPSFTSRALIDVAATRASEEERPARTSSSSSRCVDIPWRMLVMPESVATPMGIPAACISRTFRNAVSNLRENWWACTSSNGESGAYFSGPHTASVSARPISYPDICSIAARSICRSCNACATISTPARAATTPRSTVTVCVRTAQSAW